VKQSPTCTYIETVKVEIRDADTSNLPKNKVAVDVQRLLSEEKVGGLIGETTWDCRIDAQVSKETVLRRDSWKHLCSVSLAFGDCKGSVRWVYKYTRMAIERANNVEAIADFSEHDLVRKFITSNVIEN
jgi:hypothetical protein